MLKDFSKIETFLTVVKEKSFSKASKKLGISQPAVTQQIKLLEDYVDTKIVDRKKNGIRLTKAGEELYKIGHKLERCIANAEKEIIRIMNKRLTFVIGASFMIGNHILPDFLSEIKENIKNDVLVKVDVSQVVLDQLIDKKIDLALIESPIFLEGVVYREWMEDELVLFSKTPLPKYIKKEDLSSFDWICREEESHTRKIITEAFEEMDVDCKTFNILGVVTSSTAVKQTILRTPTQNKPTVSIISRLAIADEIANGTLYSAKIRGFKMRRTLYLAYLKERKHDAFMDSVVSYIMSKRKV
jgi:DNA-binding transcriptional LysR family regulator